MDHLGGLIIEKLREKNYSTWKQKIMLLLALPDPDEYIDTDAPPIHKEELA